MQAKTISKTEIALHWIVGLGMIILIGLGLYMGQTNAYSLYPFHKSIGVLLLVFILARVVIRMRKGWPDNMGSGAAWEHKLAHVIHWILILGTLVMPLSGVIDAVMAGRGLSVFGLELIGSNINAKGQPTAISTGLSDTASTVHGIVGKLLIAAILLHIAGAFKHDLVDRDGTLRRMLGRA
ncbi:cytochrome b [Halocynthiibacter sp.]|uniref:cytochrome b n=1 Tax=Halocynthiibacter sp. TaxID=1979210 RepID=UPI003C5721D0